MSERDPKVDPMPFDVLTKGGRKRTVAYVTIGHGARFGSRSEGKRVVYDDHKDREKTCDLTSWRRWAKACTVTRHGADEEAFYDRTIQLPAAVQRMLTGVTNRLISKKFDGKHPIRDRLNHTGNPYSCVSRALFELGLQSCLGWRGTNDLAAIIRERHYSEKVAEPSQ